MLSVHGRRDDGFHDLTSIVAPLAFGDTLTVGLADERDQLNCSDSTLSTGAENLILRAATVFREHVRTEQRFSFDLEKCIPIGAGLGGGSSNASIALKAMNQLCGEPLSLNELMRISAELGSDCPFFMHQQPAKMSGRGECIDLLDHDLVDRLAGIPVLLFKPDFSIGTQWAYKQLLSAAPGSYEPKCKAEQRIAELESGQSLDRDFLFNSFQSVIARKYLAIPVLLEELEKEGVPCLMSGSGSCCFALQGASHSNFEGIKRRVLEAWGESVFLVETSILAGDTFGVSGSV